MALVKNVADYSGWQRDIVGPILEGGGGRAKETPILQIGVFLRYQNSGASSKIPLKTHVRNYYMSQYKGVEL